MRSNVVTLSHTQTPMDTQTSHVVQSDKWNEMKGLKVILHFYDHFGVFQRNKLNFRRLVNVNSER